MDPSVRSRECAGTFGPVLPTLAHLLRGEQDFLERLTGEAPSEWIPRGGPPPGLDRLAALVAEGDERLRAVLAVGPDPEALAWEEGRGPALGPAPPGVLVPDRS